MARIAVARATTLAMRMGTGEGEVGDSREGIIKNWGQIRGGAAGSGNGG